MRKDAIGMPEDMSDLMKNLISMLDGKEIPDAIKNMVENLNTNSSTTAEQSTDANPNTAKQEKNSISPDMIMALMNMLNQNTSSNSTGTNTQTSEDGFHLDMGTILKLKSVMDKMNANKNDPRANLLLSLKPYLKDSRKSKVDQYVQFLKMGSIMEVLGPLGGEKKS